MAAEYRLTRAGCLAVHLMGTGQVYHGKRLEMAVKRIMERGPDGPYERHAVRLANEDDVDDPLIPTKVASEKGGE